MKELKLVITHIKILDTISNLNKRGLYPVSDGVYKIIAGVVDSETKNYLDEPTFGTDKESTEGFYGGEINSEDEVLVDITEDDGPELADPIENMADKREIVNVISTMEYWGNVHQ